MTNTNNDLQAIKTSIHADVDRLKLRKSAWNNGLKQYSDIEYKNRCINVMLEYYFIRAIFDNKTAEKIYNEGLSHVDTDYKQRIYEKLTDLQIEYATVIEDIKQAV